MVSFRVPFCIVFVLALATASLRVGAGQQPRTAVPLSVEEVVKMTQAGFTDDVIITRIKKNGKAFDLSTEELLDLKNAGVRDGVITYLLDPSQPYTPPAPPAPPPPVVEKPPEKPPERPAPPAVPPKQYPKDPYAAKAPPEPGLYRFVSDAPAAIEMKLLLGSKEGAGLGKLLLKKGELVAYMAGAGSATRTKDPTTRFYLRLPEGKGIEEVVLIALERKADRREIDMGPGPKQEIKPAAVRQFDSLEVGPQLFRITPGKLAKGEYLFFLLGSAEPPKGSSGKGYDFGVD